MKSWFDKLGRFFGEVREEILKCTRPSPRELKESTSIIIVTMAVLGVFIFVFDFVINWGLSRLITR